MFYAAVAAGKDTEDTVDDQDIMEVRSFRVAPIHAATHKFKELNLCSLDVQYILLLELCQARVTRICTLFGPSLRACLCPAALNDGLQEILDEEEAMDQANDEAQGNQSNAAQNSGVGAPAGSQLLSQISEPSSQVALTPANASRSS